MDRGDPADFLAADVDPSDGGWPSVDAGVTTATTPFRDARKGVTPRQPRSVTTVDRIVRATRTIGLRDGEAAVTLKAIAAEANVGLKSIYRYFSSPSDIIRVAVRLHIRQKFEVMQRRLGAAAYADIGHLASDVSTFIVESFLDHSLVSRPIKQRLLEAHSAIAYAEIDGIAEALVATIRRCRLAGALDAGAPEIAMALAGVAGAARQAFLLYPETFDDGRFERVAHAQILLGLAPRGGATTQ